ncbi:ABC transporter substrate-binding protein [Spelaeicoccus albus]|uniref:Polar amino acid transport system substrate-binding protein n=1 Tax=Spelaeicoccus albus TaxID=1280376 RepID=A0A7Z0D4Q7_9MICO|nr:ABC transporter substrate-binding protein [Spelaeicoccus albus]NYI68829.1 polar amino acid transport system substrate-binding protein [Spelaeicoccus albus]
MNNKRTLITSVVAVLALSVAACSNQDSEGPSNQKPSSTTESGGSSNSIISKIKTDKSLHNKLPSKIASSGVINVGADPGSPPDEYKDENGNFAGWEVDLAKAVGKTMGVKIKFTPLQFDSLIPSLQSKRINMAIGQMGVTEQRETIIDQVAWLAGNELFAARTDSSLKNITKLTQLCGINVATTRGSREQEFAKDVKDKKKCEKLNKEPINLHVFNGADQAAHSVTNGRTDVFWLGSTAVSYFVKQSNGKAKIVGHYTDKAYIGPGFSKNSKLSPLVKQAIQKLIDGGSYALLLKNWGLKDSAIANAQLNPTGTPK